MSTFARYCVFETDQGVGRLAPKSSFSVMNGVEHPEDATAASKSLFAFASAVAESTGELGWPIRLFRYMSQKTVWAPAARSFGGKIRFDAAATIPGFANSCQNGTAPSAKSIQTGFFAGSRAHGVPSARARPGTAATSASAAMTTMTLRTTRPWCTRRDGNGEDRTVRILR